MGSHNKSGTRRPFASNEDVVFVGGGSILWSIGICRRHGIQGEKRGGEGWRGKRGEGGILGHS